METRKIAREKPRLTTKWETFRSIVTVAALNFALSMGVSPQAKANLPQFENTIQEPPQEQIIELETESEPTSAQQTFQFPHPGSTERVLLQGADLPQFETWDQETEVDDLDQFENFTQKPLEQIQTELPKPFQELNLAEFDNQGQVPARIQQTFQFPHPGSTERVLLQGADLPQFETWENNLIQESKLNRFENTIEKSPQEQIKIEPKIIQTPQTFQFPPTGSTEKVLSQQSDLKTDKTLEQREKENNNKTMEILSAIMLVLKTIATVKIVKEVGVKTQNELESRNLNSTSFNSDKKHLEPLPDEQPRTIEGEMTSLIDNVYWLSANLKLIATDNPNYAFHLVNTAENLVDITAGISIMAKLYLNKPVGENIQIKDIKYILQKVSELVKNIDIKAELSDKISFFRAEFTKKLGKEEVTKRLNTLIKLAQDPKNSRPEVLVEIIKNLFTDVIPKNADKILLLTFIASLLLQDSLIAQLISVLKDTIYNFRTTKSKDYHPPTSTAIPDIVTNSLWAMQNWSIYSAYGLLHLITTLLGIIERNLQKGSIKERFIEDLNEQKTKLNTFVEKFEFLKKENSSNT